LEFWVTLGGRKAHSDRGHQQERPATPAEQRRNSALDRKRAAAARSKRESGR